MLPSRVMLALGAWVSTATVSLPAMAQDKTVNVLDWGGAYGQSHQMAYNAPFQEKTGTRVVVTDADNPATPIKAMVEAGNVTADVASVEYADAVRLCDEGLLEEIDQTVLAAAEDGTGAIEDFIEGGVTDCFVATDVYSMVQVYDDSKFADAKPATPADFFDVAKFPGKRTMRKGAKFNLEFALMADGVKSADVYKVLGTKEGAERAFKKLDQIKRHVAAWWTTGAQQVQLLQPAPQPLIAGFGIAAQVDELPLGQDRGQAARIADRVGDQRDDLLALHPRQRNFGKAPMRGQVAVGADGNDRPAGAQLAIERAFPADAGDDALFRVKVQKHASVPLRLQPRGKVLRQRIVGRAVAEEQRAHEHPSS